ncbi:hypothetical protein Unana1_07501 [Umbelopsis nana]
MPAQTSGLHLTDSCSELYITPNRTSTVLKTKLDLNMFQANYKTALSYFQQNGWGDILGAILGIPGSEDTKYLWAITNTTNGMDLKFCKVHQYNDTQNVSTFMIVDWKISHQLYSLNTGLNSDSPWYTYVQPNFVWPPDTPGKAPNYIFLGKSSIRGYIPDDGKWVLAVPTLDYGEPYPLPPAPETITFVFNANMTMQNTTSYAYITKTVVRVDLPLYLVVLLAIFVAVAIIGLYIRKSPVFNTLTAH